MFFSGASARRLERTVLNLICTELPSGEAQAAERKLTAIK
jgi:hypothetical protein